MKSESYITVIAGTDEPKLYSLDYFGKDSIRFGRGEYHGDSKSEKNDISVSAEISIVSRAHCTFEKSAGGWRIKDDGSFNGLVFNGGKISSQILHDGDKFYIGSDADKNKCVIIFSNGNKTRGNKGKIPLSGKNKFVIGRSAECDLVLDHPSVSRQHCTIVRENDKYYVYDNGSLNGILYNGRPLSGKQLLSEMDKITIADTSVIFYDSSLFVIENEGGVSVSVRKLVKKVKVRGEEKIITNNVSLSIEPGEFAAIIGGSGAGKTTLLNCISGLSDFTQGDVIINGESIITSGKSLRSIMGYVPQNDIVYNDLTLERMLIYSAKLRMPSDTSSDEINKKIDEVLGMVELTKHRQTLICKLSGGQKKRASIAVELLASPRLFFLDEPSSGLDPGTEKHLMMMLKKLASSGKTVIMVTHTVQNINMCDKLICMGNGGLLCYSGSPEGALEFFGKTDFTDIYDELNDNSVKTSERFSREYGISENPSPPGDIRAGEKKAGFTRSVKQFTVMTKRYTEIMLNSRFKLILLMLMPVILTCIVCAAFQADGNLFNYLGIEINRTSLPFVVASDTMKFMFTFSCAGFWVGIFNSVQEISKERIIYEREQFAGVRPLPYVLSKFTVIGVICIIQSAVMTALFLFFANTTATVDADINSVTALKIEVNSAGAVFSGNGMWLELFITLLLSVLSAMGLGLAVSAAVSNEMSMVLCPICLLPQILFSGVICKLSGITETLSNIITCRWTCVAYFTSAGVNDLYESCVYDTGTWTKTEFSNGFGVDEAYASYKEYLFGMNPVCSAWTAMGIITVICIAAAVVFIWIKDVKINKIKKLKRSN